MKFIIALLVQEVKRYVVISLILVYKCLKIKRKKKLISTFLCFSRYRFGSKNDTARAAPQASPASLSARPRQGGAAARGAAPVRAAMMR
ncbi:MAG: hypothetical protein V4754_13350 [Pseudomonadota bacterium]